MKKIILSVSFLTVLLTNFISAATFSLSEITNVIDSNTLVLLLVFAASFLVLFFLFNKIIKSNDSAPSIIALLFSSGITFGIHKSGLDLSNLFFDLGFQEETLYILIPILVSAFIIFLIARFRKKSLLILGGLFLLVSLFVKSKEITIAVGVFLIIVWFLLKIKRRARNPRIPRDRRPPHQKNRKRIHRKWTRRKNKRNNAVQKQQKQHQKVRTSRHNKWNRRKNRRNKVSQRQNPILNRANSPRVANIKQQKKNQRQHQRKRKLRHAQWATRKGYRNVKTGVVQGTAAGQKGLRYAGKAARKGYRNVKQGISQKYQARQQRIQTKQQQRGKQAIKESKRGATSRTEQKRLVRQKAKAQSQQQRGKSAIIEEKQRQAIEQHKKLNQQRAQQTAQENAKKKKMLTHLQYLYKKKEMELQKWQMMNAKGVTGAKQKIRTLTSEIDAIAQKFNRYN